MDNVVRGARLVFAALLALVVVQIGGAQPAMAATSVVFKSRTLSAPTGKVHSVVALGSIALNVTANQTSYVESVMRVNAATYRVLVDNEVRCTGPGGWSKNMVIGQNVYASGARPWDDVRLTTRFLVHPGAAGVVKCTTYARGASLGHSNESVRLFSGSLRFATVRVTNSTTGAPIQSSVYRGRPLTPKTPTVREPATGMFNVPSGKTGLSVFGDTEFQIDCTKANPPGCGVADTTTARFTLYVNQWKSDGSLCYSDYVSVTKKLSYAVHHAYVPLHFPNFTISKSRGCIPRFNSYVRVDRVGGMNGTVQGIARGLTATSSPTSPKHNADMSHIFVVPF